LILGYSCLCSLSHYDVENIFTIGAMGGQWCRQYIRIADSFPERSTQTIKKTHPFLAAVQNHLDMGNQTYITRGSRTVADWVEELVTQTPPPLDPIVPY